MGKLQEFLITLNDNKVVYSPGESISGTVKISTAQSIQCKAIKVNCYGFCGVTSKVNDTEWTQEEQYFNSSITVTDKAKAPTSFEGPYGKIIYQIRAFIDTPRFSKDYKAEKLFYMLNQLNLNVLPDIYEPNTSSVTKNFTYMLVKNGTVELTTKTDQRGYTAGQVIKVSAVIDNKSGKSTGTIVASLIQRVTYHPKKQTNATRVIAEVEGAGVKAGKQGEWKEQIIVPPLPQSVLDGCSLIEINYFVQVTLKYPEILLTLPIHIGNVALGASLRPSPKPSKVAPVPAPRANPASPAIPATSPTSPPHADSPNLPPRPAPRPRPRSMCLTPSAPLAEPDMMGAVNGQSEPIPTKIHSQQQGPVSPNAFSYAPGLAFQQSGNNPSAPGFCFSTGATIPFYTEGNAPPVPTSCPFVLPPDYSSAAPTHEPPPSYEASCS
ncbi:arrestin domain-containing protein 1a isoform X2 [Trichomycterus rosablanca]|uniref:arrestin domain-containing protein 1a isoform X2 n=1 Tax=Trichomycterus rosablanca TaxID=2290929 RepID=UPI002F35F70C